MALNASALCRKFVLDNVVILVVGAMAGDYREDAYAEKRGKRGGGEEGRRRGRRDTREGREEGDGGESVMLDCLEAGPSV